VTEVGEHLVVQLRTLLEELATLSDPGAAAVQIESVTSEAGEQVAAALARATRAERATRAAEVDREQADTAAEEALLRLEEVNADLERTKQSWRAEVEDLTAAQQTLERDHQTAMAEAAAVAATAAEEHRQALAAAAQERAELTAAHDRSLEEAHEAALAREDVLTSRVEEQLRSTEQARQEADAARRSAEGEARAVRSAMERAEVETATGRAQLAQLRELEWQLRDEAAQLRTDLAVTRNECEAAQSEVARERATADQRVREVRDLLAVELARLHEEVDTLRQGAQSPKGRAKDGAPEPVTPTRRRGRKTEPADGDTTG